MVRTTTLLAAIAAVFLTGCAQKEAASDGKYLLSDLIQATRDPALTPRAQVQAVVDWTHRHLEWTGTDYKDRTVAGVLQRGGGNCREQAIVVRAALEDMGIRVRQIREINLHKENAGRGVSAVAAVAEQGPRASVFGSGHNDHVWIEYWDETADSWAPADPTLNLVGYETWVEARLGFGERPVHDILPSRDMLAPILVLAETENPDAPFENRSEEYLIDRFAQYIPTAQNNASLWRDWVTGVRAFAPLGKGAFNSDTNLHHHEDLIETLRATYIAMREVQGKSAE